MKISDKTALITGAARGIGQAVAVELARSGADIIGVDLKLDDLQQTSYAVKRTGRKFFGYSCNVVDDVACGKLVKNVSGVTGGFDILINNAGILPSGPFAERDFETWRKTVEVNLIGLMAMTYAVLPYFRQRDEAHIANIASIAGKFGTEGVAAYAASKHGVVGFSSALAEEFRDTHIGVSWICPSLARTRLTEGVRHTYLTPLVEPEAVARAVRRAIAKGAHEVFVPRRMRFIVSILPAFSSGLARWISRRTKASDGWLEARKEIAG